MPRTKPTRDPRRRRTREALQSAFILLAMERRYHLIRIDDILRASDVGRSTFYEHFAGKDALLAASMEDAFALLAGLPFDDGASPGQVAALLAHFFDRRALAASLFQGSALRILRKTLVGQVEARLRRGGDRLRMPPRLAAHALADGIFSPLLAWLAGESACTAHELAAALSASSRGMRAGLVAASS